MEQLVKRTKMKLGRIKDEINFPKAHHILKYLDYNKTAHEQWGTTVKERKSLCFCQLCQLCPYLDITLLHLYG